MGSLQPYVLDLLKKELAKVEESLHEPIVVSELKLLSLVREEVLLSLKSLEDDGIIEKHETISSSPIYSLHKRK